MRHALAIAIALADRLRERGEDPVAVSADSMQLYAGLPILTGAADAQEQTRLEHRLLGCVPIHETFSAGAFARRAHQEDRQCIRPAFHHGLAPGYLPRCCSASQALPTQLMPRRYGRARSPTVRP